MSPSTPKAAGGKAPAKATTTQSKGSIADRAMLVHLRLSHWHARRFERKASEDTARRAKAEAGTFRGYKRLLDNKLLSQYYDMVGKARGVTYRFTSPWLDGGVRVLPNELYPEFEKAVRPLLRDMNKAAEQFVEAYPKMIEDAKKQLGDMFNKDDYPSADDVRVKFRTRLTVFPIPDAGKDWRVGDASYLDTITQASVLDAWVRVADLMDRVATQLAKNEGGVRQSLLNKVTALAELLPKLNITGDGEVAKALGTMRNQLAKLDRKTLRENPEVRKDKAKIAKDLATRAAKYVSAQS